MRDDQKKRLEQLRDKLLEVALVDADPSLWVGAGKAPVEMTQKERGDAVWCRKMAAATVGLFARVHNVVATHGEPSAGDPKDEDLLEAQVREAERQAAEIISRIQQGQNVH